MSIQKTLGSISFLCLSHLAAVAFAPTTARAEIPPEVRQALQDNVRALSPITVVWEERRGSELSVHAWLRKIKASPLGVDSFLPKTITYCWQDGMSYSSVFETKVDLSNAVIVDDAEKMKIRIKPGVNLDKLPRVGEDHETACNLEDLFRGTGKETLAGTAGLPSFNVDPIDDPKIYPPDGRVFSPTYFYEAGFVLPDTIAKQKVGARSLPLALIDEGATVIKAEEVSLDGHVSFLIELEDKGRRKRFYFDPSREFAVHRREELTPAGQRLVVAQMRDFVRFHNPDIWLPKRCDVNYHTWRTNPEMITEKPLTYERFVVQKIEKEPIPVERFTLHYTMPGTLVSDASIPQAKELPAGQVTYEVPADQRDLDAVIQHAVDGTPFVPRALQEKRRFRLLCVAVSLLVVGLFVFWLWRRPQ
jgi:hypothetical protein